MGASRAFALEHVTLKHNGVQRQVDGRLLVEAQDGGLILQERDGTLWLLQADEQIARTHDDVAFTPMTRDEMQRHLLAALPRGFDVHPTAHYLIFHDTSKAYALWCGSLFERLYMAFTNYWSRKGFTLQEPEFPLVAIVFSERADYLKHSQPTLGDAAESIVAYFNLRDNRMVMYDLTGADRAGLRQGTTAQINQILAQPKAFQQVATIVHEATHQIAFNCGLHTRYSDCPRWFSEGIAVFFETPDLRSQRGWGGIGEVNRSRLAQFQQYLRNRPADSLATLVRDDKRFLDPAVALDAYGESWALTYYLIRFRPEQFVLYLGMLSAKKPGNVDTPEARLEEFQKVFGNLEQLDAELVRYASRLR
jgi:hypothetical protein